MTASAGDGVAIAVWAAGGQRRRCAIILRVVRGTLLLALASIVVAGTVARSAGDPQAVGPRLDPSRLPQLPREGLAAQVGRPLVLVSINGRVLGHLDGYTLDSDPALEWHAPGPWPLKVRDRSGARLLLQSGNRKLVGLGRDRIPLAGRAVLVRTVSGWTLRRGQATTPLPQLRRFGPDFISEGRDLLTVFGGNGTRVLDVSDRRWTTVPAGCRAAARRGSRWFLLCGYPFPFRGGGNSVKTSSTLLLRERDGRVHTLVGPAETSTIRGRGPVGWWTSAFLSADGSRFLLQWSGECESPTAFLAPATGGKARPVTGERSLRRAPESVALGWAGDGRALVELPKGACGSGASKPGVYLVAPAGGARAFVYRHGSFWRSRV